jgi:ABC-type ATPase involved in cell division
MKISISDNIINHYLRNVYFINGHSYAGKSTMVKMLAERYDMVSCG